ncbi:hypothetical protein G6O67_001156 [Ophiocordyceps sinensis]|uniref:PKS/mFAS DH domain-containing protein n=1 Tax=Ophiocordyceps sinensis TaxID=72228 RepID=A0A8H4PWS8_9HYPO|nr:hypothetical protein G6O67_001156 [Ophiocordyceps sinensis]
MVQPVLFSEAVQFAVQTLPAPLAIALEVGPHPALKGPVSQTLKSLAASPLPYAGSLERGKGDVESMSAASGMVYWRESRLSHNFRVGGQPPHSLLGRQREDSPYEKTWRNFFHLEEMPWVKGHTFQGQVLFPGAGYVSLAVEASKAFVKNRPIKLLEVRDMNIPKALVMGEDKGVEVLFTIRSKTISTTVADGSVVEAEQILSCRFRD